MGKWSLLGAGYMRWAISIDKSGSCTCLWKDEEMRGGRAGQMKQRGAQWVQHVKEGGCNLLMTWLSRRCG